MRSLLEKTHVRNFYASVIERENTSPTAVWNSGLPIPHPMQLLSEEISDVLAQLEKGLLIGR